MKHFFALLVGLAAPLPYAPVDSSGGAAWRGMAAAFTNGTLASGLVATCFTPPRPVYELYDPEAGRSELNNLSGKPGLGAVERTLRMAMTEKMILDFEFLLLPATETAVSTARARGRNGSCDFQGTSK